MDYDRNKVDEMVLALLYLTIHDVEEGEGAAAWKGYDWDVMNRLYEKGYIDNPRNKNKSVWLTEEGLVMSRALFAQNFGKKK